MLITICYLLSLLFIIVVYIVAAKKICKTDSQTQQQTKEPEDPDQEMLNATPEKRKKLWAKRLS